MRSTKFFKALKENLDSAMFMLGTDYHLNNVETIADIKAKITPQDIRRLWDHVEHFSPTRMQVMVEGNQRVVTALKQAMLRDMLFAQHISDDSLMHLGTKTEWYRDCLIALIRKHLLQEKRDDPFEEIKFDLLEIGGPEQNYLYLSPFIGKCKSLPIKNIVALGLKNEKMASFILKDCGDCEDYFSISEAFTEIPALRKKIADNWQAYLETHPLTKYQKQIVLQALKILKAKHPEFKEVNLHARVKKFYRRIDPQVSDQLFDTASLAIMTPATLYFSPQMAAHALSIVKLSAGLASGVSAPIAGALAWTALTTAPLALIPFVAQFGISYVYENYWKKEAPSAVARH